MAKIEAYAAKSPPAYAQAVKVSGAQTMLYIAGDRKSTRLNSSHIQKSRMPSSA